MANLSNWTMRAGRGDEQVAGYVFQTTIKGHTSREWVAGVSRASAFKIASRKAGLDWARCYTIENGQRVVLA